MKKIITEAALDEAILKSKTKQIEEGNLLKEEFHSTFEKLKPANIVKNAIRKTVASSVLRDNIILKTVDVAIVLLTNRILRKRTNSIVKRTVGIGLVWGIKTIVSRNPEIIKKAGNGILKLISNIIAKRNRKREYTYNSSM